MAISSIIYFFASDPIYNLVNNDEIKLILQLKGIDVTTSKVKVYSVKDKAVTTKDKLSPDLLLKIIDILEKTPNNLG